MGGDADRHRVGVVTFAEVSSREPPHRAGSLRGIDDINAVAAKPSGQRPPKAGRTFDRPSVHYGLADGCQAVRVSASWGRVRNTRRNLPI